MQAQTIKDLVLARRCEIIHPKHYATHIWALYGLFDIVGPF